MPSIARHVINRLGKRLLPKHDERDLVRLRQSFDPDFYRFLDPKLDDLSPSQLFDHFLDIGHAEGRDPNAEFSTKAYLEINPDVGSSSINAYAHFLRLGELESRVFRLSTWNRPISDPMADTIPVEDLDAILDRFDPEYYRMSNPELAALSDRALAAHFLVLGWPQGSNPNADFSVQTYLELNPDIAEAGLNPFLHFILFGEREGRSWKRVQPVRLFSERMADFASDPATGIAQVVDPALDERGDTVATGMLIEPTGSIETAFPHFYTYLEDRHPQGTDPNGLSGEIERDYDEIVINWISPNFELVSGGMRNAFELIRYLESRGFRNNLHIFGDTHYRDGDQAKEMIARNYCQIEADVFLGIDDVQPADIVVAVGWQSAWPVKNAIAAPLKVFLVQDFDPWLCIMGSEYVLAEAPLNFGFYGLTLGPWVQKVVTDYGMRATSFELAIEHDVFRPIPTVIRKPNRVVFYGRYVTPRRAFELGVLALSIVKTERPDIEICFHGWGEPSTQVPFEYVDCGIMDDEDRAKLYASATVGMALSLTNASVVPLEMMACKLPVVELLGDNTNTFYGAGHERFISLADRHPRAIANAIIALLDDAQRCQDIGNAAYEYVRTRTWENMGQVVEECLRDELARVSGGQ